MEKRIKMEQALGSWEGNKSNGFIKDITFCVTEECNLACKYCYMIGKNRDNKMSLETAKKAVDYILDNTEKFSEESVVWNFIGGEPFLEIDLIDKVADYIKLRMFELDHPWFDSYRFSFSSNGLLYSSEKVQKFIKKNRAHLSIGISVDGNKIKHDLQRVYENGNGSYDNVMKNVELWIKQFPGASTKATFSTDDLIHLKDSVISLWENGIKSVSANVVFEDVWKDGDDLIFEQQLNELGDYIIENKLWDQCQIRFFEPSIGNKLNREDLDKGVCGSGKMLAIDCNGELFPCIRFLDFSLNKRKGLSIGNIDTGILEDKIRPFKTLSFKEISDEECLNCEVASGCNWCVGYNYDEYGTLFSRAKHICKMHKANVRANKRFWKKYEKATGNISPRNKYENIKDKKFLQILTDDNIKTTCLYNTSKEEKENLKMSKELFNKAVKFAEDNDYEIVLLGDKKEGITENYYTNMVSSGSDNITKKSIVIYDNSAEGNDSNNNVCILLINKENTNNIFKYVEKLRLNNSRINVILQDINDWTEQHIKDYENELDKLVENIKKEYIVNKSIDINILTDRLNFKEHCGCDAGEETITLAPDGNFYICPAFYFDKIDRTLGNIDEGIDKGFMNEIKTSSSRLCKQCYAYQCKQCKYLNKKYTGEYKVSPKNQCIISNIEKSKSKIIQDFIIDKGFKIDGEYINESDYVDPLIKIERGE